jgi:type III restriction enzyme
LIKAEVDGWRNQGYFPFPSETTLQLLRYWFEERDEADQRFHPCQRAAIETVIYLHEIRQVRSLRDLYEQFAPEQLNLFKSIADEAAAIPFIKYCIKSATGSGKTWVLAALVVWQYFNAINEEMNAPYSPRFMIVTPGLEVRSRILDSFRGRRDPKTGNRNPADSDYRRSLFMPDDMHWRGRFNLLDAILAPEDIRSNSTPPDGPFVAVVNWQQFVMPREKESLAEQLGLVSFEEPQGEVIADFMTEYPDLVIMNDEAHHVHGKKTARADELVWRRFMDVLYRRMRERHGDAAGLFAQVDFSATPFYGSGPNREYFPHIVYDYDLRDALNDMLVKQLFLEERVRQPGQPDLQDLDFNAERDDKRQVIRLSMGQKQLLDIGLSKLNQLTEDFANKGLNRKPVYMILCEDTTVADLVHDHLLTCKGPEGNLLQPRNLLLFHSELKKEKHGYTLDEARGGTGVAAGRSHATLDSIDDDSDPLRVVISVLALREGFDKSNICVICALRASEADILLEQVVGRGLRLMFPAYKTDATVQEAKRQAFEALKNGERPNCSLDFLYIVEHPKFRTFYDDLRRQGYLIGSGDSRDTQPTGDLVPVEAMPDRIPVRDIAWPLAVQEESKLPDLSAIDVDSLPAYRITLEQQRTLLTSLAVTDRHLETDTRAETWMLRDKYFDYDSFLRTTSTIIASQGKTRVLSAKLAQIAAVVDEYVSRRLFKEQVDFSDEHNYKVLADRNVADFVTTTLRNVIHELLGHPQYEVRSGSWRRLSDLTRLLVRENSSIPTRRCIYPRMPVAARFGGLERQVMETTLDASPEVLAWCKLQRKHGLSIAYRDSNGLLRNYEVDFVLRTADSCFILETKADRDLALPNVGTKARAARHWCESISGVAPPEGLEQPVAWEYLLLSESVYRANSGAGFNALLPLMRQVRDRVIAEQQGKLFA